MTWLNSQKTFIENQLIPYIAEHRLGESINLICLGDVFDSRSSVNVMVMHEVRALFKKLAGFVDNFFIISGNHDMYSEQTDTYCSLEIILSNLGDNVHIISDKPFVYPTDAWVPGYQCVMFPWAVQKELGIQGMNEFASQYNYPYIFTHSDIITGSPRLKYPTFSGHIHTPYINGNVRNLGSCYPLTFTDANEQRFFYVWDPKTDELQRIANEHSIRFWRIRDERIFEDWSTKIHQDDYIEIYINASVLQTEQYQEVIQNFTKRYRNCWVIPKPESTDNNSEINIDCNIDDIVAQCIPENLIEKFNIIKEKYYGSSES